MKVGVLVESRITPVATVVACTDTAATGRHRKCYREREAAPDARPVTVVFAASQIG